MKRGVSSTRGQEVAGLNYEIRNIHHVHFAVIYRCTKPTTLTVDGVQKFVTHGTTERKRGLVNVEFTRQKMHFFFILRDKL